MARGEAARERDAQRRVARRYRMMGYDVVERPSPEVLPDFMDGILPDVVARSVSDNVVVEIKTHASLTGSNDLVAMAEKVSAHPDWRFELVVMDDATTAAAEISDAEFEARLARARHAAEVGSADVAFAFLVQLIAIVARDLAGRNGVGQRGKSDRDVLIDLGFEGIVPPPLLERCLAAVGQAAERMRMTGSDAVPSSEAVAELSDLCDGLRQLL
ncbi:hypothetical protein D3273_09775 [Lichenibacterium minor]|uniref:REase AHJR-like domain-containing protein n=1 Tax=Lichenibacterium minor TaxID=2316528 RepID=A0A4Q2UB61_9HYPH|nr:hypothetical protein [Lichenibacterium minor]RYC32306.1 hypothetical protein D3273_09775 [Lichenibacterium minor]